MHVAVVGWRQTENWRIAILWTNIAEKFRILRYRCKKKAHPCLENQPYVSESRKIFLWEKLSSCRLGTNVTVFNVPKASF